MASTRPAFLGVDIGTTAVKAVLVDVEGRVLGEAEVEQPISSPRPGWTEQDPNTWWDSTKLAISQVVHQTPGAAEVRSIGLSGQMHSSVFLDERSEVIRPALLWNDVRTTAQCVQITETMGLPGLHRTVGNLALEGFTAPKVLWLRDNEPDAYDRLHTLLLAKDYIRYKLTGEFATEPSDAAGTLFYDVRNQQWSDEILNGLDISPNILPSVVESTEVSGKLIGSVAAELGLPTGLPVVGGGADNAAGAVGNGVVEVGLLQSTIGTSGALLTPVDTPEVDDQMRLHTFCHSVPDLWYMMGVILSAGNSLRWLRDVLMPSGADGAYETLTAEAVEVSPGSEGLFFLPYLTGERTPQNDSTARGVFFGLHLGHTRAHMVRAVLEGVCFALRESLELMPQTDFSEVRAIGGGTRGNLWRQLQADIFGLPVVTMGPSSGPPYGAAAMAAVGSGEFNSIPEVTNSWLYADETIEPNVQNIDIYTELFDAYRELYPTLKGRFANNAALFDRVIG